MFIYAFQANSLTKTQKNKRNTHNWWVIFCNFYQMLTHITTNRGIKMEALGVLGFIFGLGALGKIIILEKQLKKLGVIKEKAEFGKN